MAHGNLYWDIQFTALYNGASGPEASEQVSFSVEGHDFADTYNRAQALYMALRATNPDSVYSIGISLRDDGTAVPTAKYRIYRTYHIYDEDIAEFFNIGPDKCRAVTWI